MLALPPCVCSLLAVRCLLCGRSCEVWPVAALESSSSSSSSTVHVTCPARRDRSLAGYLSWNCCCSPFFFFFFLKNEPPCSQECPALSHRAIVAKTALFEQWRAAPLSFKYDLVCQQLDHSRSGLFLVQEKRRGKIGGAEFWSGSWCYISAEPVNHAAHVRGLLCSCHRAGLQTGRTHTGWCQKLSGSPVPPPPLPLPNLKAPLWSFVLWLLVCVVCHR